MFEKKIKHFPTFDRLYIGIIYCDQTKTVGADGINVEQVIV